MMHVCLDRWGRYALSFAPMAAKTRSDLATAEGGESILAYVRRRLDEAKGMWPRIAAETSPKVPYFTIANISRGKSTNPGIDSLQPLLDWFRAYDETRKKVRQA